MKSNELEKNKDYKDNLILLFNLLLDIYDCTTAITLLYLINKKIIGKKNKK